MRNQLLHSRNCWHSIWLRIKNDTLLTFNHYRHYYNYHNNNGTIRFSTNLLLYTAAAAAAVVTTVVNDFDTTTYSYPLLLQCEGIQGNNEPQQIDDEEKEIIVSSRLIFLGTGSSTGCPRPLCSLMFSNIINIHNNNIPNNNNNNNNINNNSNSSDPYLPFCQTSIIATTDEPRYNKNYRNNPSMLISLNTKTIKSTKHDDTDHDQQHQYQQKNVIIDVGKTFRESTIRWLPKYNINSIDAIILTHEHMDAAGGLDDVRGYQKWNFINNNKTTKTKSNIVIDNNNQQEQQHSRPIRPIQIPMPLYLSKQCYNKLQDQFPWLLPRQKHHEIVNELSPNTTSIDTTNSNQKIIVHRHVASFHVNVFESYQSIDIFPKQKDLLSIIPLPIMHGEDFISYGYSFTLNESNILYISDISRMIPETMEYIQTQLLYTDILILDTLSFHNTNPVHYNLNDAIQLSKLIQQLNHNKKHSKLNDNDVKMKRKRMKILLVGMNCDDFPPHDEFNQYLKEKYGNELDIQFAHDGLVIEL